MTNAQKLTIRASEIRQRLNEIAGLEGDALSDEVRAEETALQTDYRDTETKLRAAIAAEPDPRETRDKTETAEDRERRELRSKATIGGFVGACLRNEPVAGAEAEYAAVMGCPGAMPIDMLAPIGVETREAAEVEERAVTPGQNVPAGTQTPIPYVFERTVSARLGVTMPTIPAGVKHYPVLTTAPPAGPKAKDAAADSTAAAFTLNNRTAKRITGQFAVRREDLAVMPGMEESQRSAMGDSMSALYWFGLSEAVKHELSGFVTSATREAVPRLEAITGQSARVVDVQAGPLLARLTEVDDDGEYLDGACVSAVRRWWTEASEVKWHSRGIGSWKGPDGRTHRVLSRAPRRRRRRR